MLKMTSKLKMEFCLIKIQSHIFHGFSLLDDKIFPSNWKMSRHHRTSIVDLRLYIWRQKIWIFFDAKFFREIERLCQDFKKSWCQIYLWIVAKIWIEISKKAMGNEGLHTKKPHFFERNTIRIVFFCDSQPRQ